MYESVDNYCSKLNYWFTRSLIYSSALHPTVLDFFSSSLCFFSVLTTVTVSSQIQGQSNDVFYKQRLVTYVPDK